MANKKPVDKELQIIICDGIIRTKDINILKLLSDNGYLLEEFTEPGREKYFNNISPSYRIYIKGEN